mmetsp:Transcript_4956/g.8603  ORF Transcript_4956/g.8603 Transcript_4956/m.8603 type:complete len:518 (-) Transcript_4956:320-1873(-)
MEGFGVGNMDMYGEVELDVGSFIDGIDMIGYEKQNEDDLKAMGGLNFDESELLWLQRSDNEDEMNNDRDAKSDRVHQSYGAEWWENNYVDVENGRSSNGNDLPLFTEQTNWNDSSIHSEMELFEKLPVVDGVVPTSLNRVGTENRIESLSSADINNNDCSLSNSNRSEALEVSQNSCVKPVQQSAKRKRVKDGEYSTAAIAGSSSRNQSESSAAVEKELRETKKRMQLCASENSELRRQMAKLKQENRSLNGHIEYLSRLLAQSQQSMESHEHSSPVFGVARVPQDVAVQIQSAMTLSRPSSGNSAKKAGGVTMLCFLLVFGIFVGSSIYQSESQDLVALEPGLVQADLPRFHTGGRVLASLPDGSSDRANALALPDYDSDRSSGDSRRPFYSEESRYSIIARDARFDEDGDIHSQYLKELHQAYEVYSGDSIPDSFIMCGDVLSVLHMDKVDSRDRNLGANCENYLVSLVLPARTLGLNVTANDNSFAELNCGVRSISQFGLPVHSHRTSMLRVKT